MKRLLTFILLVFSLLSLGPYAMSQDTKVYEEKKALLEREIEVLDRQLSENTSRSRSEFSR